MAIITGSELCIEGDLHDLKTVVCLFGKRKAQLVFL